MNGGSLLRLRRRIGRRRFSEHHHYSTGRAFAACQPAFGLVCLWRLEDAVQAEKKIKKMKGETQKIYRVILTSYNTTVFSMEFRPTEFRLNPHHQFAQLSGPPRSVPPNAPP
jgi:hypothetical protein